MGFSGGCLKGGEGGRGRRKQRGGMWIEGRTTPVFFFLVEHVKPCSEDAVISDDRGVQVNGERDTLVDCYTDSLQFGARPINLIKQF